MTFAKGNKGIGHRAPAFLLNALFVFAAGCCPVCETKEEEVSTAHVAAEKLHAKEAAHVEEHPHWSYEGESGPAHWGSLCAGFSLCSVGTSQSPIDITGATEMHLPDIEFDYKASALNIINNGHTIQVNYDEGSSITIDGTEEYALKQFHFHAPSEHTVDGEHYDMEMHLVHQNADGGLAVVGVLKKKGVHKWPFSPVWDNLPTDVGKEYRITNVSINAGNLIPGNRLHYRYEGSLTTPHCSEGVKWFVLATPVEMSGSQIDAFKAIVHDNNRPVQPLNNRELHMDVSVD